MQVKLISWSAYSHEKHVSTIYTRKLFRRLQNNFRDSLLFDVEEHENRTYTFVHVKDKKRFLTKYEASSGMVSCNCKLFESPELPCTHMLEVYRKFRMKIIPPHYILKKWTKYVKKDLALGFIRGTTKA